MRKKSLIKRKILFYLDYKEVSKYEFYKNSGISRSTLDKDSGMSEDNIAKFIAYEPNINLEWLFNSSSDLTTDSMLKNSYEIESKPLNVAESNVNFFRNRTDRIITEQHIPLYDLESVGGISFTFDDYSKITPIDYIYMPNAPLCDGSLFAVGDSMYPIIKSGDVIAYKIIHDYLNDVYYGKVYTLLVEIAGSISRITKYVQKGRNDEYITLVSHNTHHQPKEIHLSKVKGIAEVKLAVRHF